MLTSMFTLPPAGVPGWGCVDARPYAVAVRPALLGTLARVPGSGLPAAGPAPRFRGSAPTAFDQHHPTAETWAVIGTQNDGTTPLGNLSSGRPLS